MNERRIDSNTWHAMRDAEIAGKLRKPGSQPAPVPGPRPVENPGFPVRLPATPGQNGTHS